MGLLTFFLLLLFSAIESLNLSKECQVAFQIVDYIDDHLTINEGGKKCLWELEHVGVGVVSVTG